MHQTPMPLSDRTARAQALARTYSDINDRDGWTRVEEYQRVMDWRAEHPNLGSSAASSRLNLPRSRIRPWFNGSKPDPARAVEIADINGWLDATFGDRVFEALNVLHAWTIAGGSIQAAQYVPQLAIGRDDPRDLAEASLSAVGTGVTTARESEPGRGAELRPASHASVLGRFLVAVLGAPLGEKAHTNVTIPDWLLTAPFDTRLRWTRTVVTLRGTPFDERHGYRIQLREEGRPNAYYQELGGLFAEIVGDANQVTVGAQTVRLRDRAAAMLDVTPTLLD